MIITFSGKLDRQTAENPENYAVKIWGLKRTANYGSNHDNERNLKVTGVAVSADGRTVLLKIPDVETTWCMEIRYRIKGANGEDVNSMIHNSVHRLGQPQTP